MSLKAWKKARHLKEVGTESKTTQPDINCTIRMVSDPEGADIMVDSRFMGNTPARLNLSPGKHRIELTIEGYEQWIREVEALAGSELSLNARLKKLNEKIEKKTGMKLDSLQIITGRSCRPRRFQVRSFQPGRRGVYWKHNILWSLTVR